MSKPSAARAMDLRGQFERTWHWLAAAMDRFGNTHSKEDLWQSVEIGSAQLWPLSRSAMLTTVETYPNGVRRIHGWLAGGELSQIVNYIPTIEDWARSAGCTEAEIVGRKGWLRAFTDYHDAGTIMRKKL